MRKSAHLTPVADFKTVSRLQFKKKREKKFKKKIKRVKKCFRTSSVIRKTNKKKFK